MGPEEVTVWIRSNAARTEDVGPEKGELHGYLWVSDEV